MFQWFKKKRDPHERIEKIKEVLEEFDLDIKKIFHSLDILEQKFQSKWFPKKKPDSLEGSMKEDKNESEPIDLRSSILLPE